MPNLSRRQRMPLTVFAILALMPGSARLVAQQTRQVSVETLIYDLKSPDAGRREAAARELGVVKYRSAIPQLVALANDPAASVRRAVEVTLERMEDIQTLPGFIAFASDAEDDIRSRAVDALVNVHLPRAAGVAAALTNIRERIVYRPNRRLRARHSTHRDPWARHSARQAGRSRSRAGRSRGPRRRSAIRCGSRPAKDR